MPSNCTIYIYSRVFLCFNDNLKRSNMSGALCSCLGPSECRLYIQFFLIKFHTKYKWKDERLVLCRVTPTGSDGISASPQKWPTGESAPAGTSARMMQMKFHWPIAFFRFWFWRDQSSPTGGTWGFCCQMVSTSPETAKAIES